MTVIELSPGGGWYTEILANYIHYPGTLIAAHLMPIQIGLITEGPEQILKKKFQIILCTEGWRLSILIRVWLTLKLLMLC